MCATPQSERAFGHHGVICRVRSPRPSPGVRCGTEFLAVWKCLFPSLWKFSFPYNKTLYHYLYSIHRKSFETKRFSRGLSVYVTNSVAADMPILTKTFSSREPRAVPANLRGTASVREALEHSTFHHEPPWYGQYLSNPTLHWTHNSTPLLSPQPTTPQPNNPRFPSHPPYFGFPTCVGALLFLLLGSRCCWGSLVLTIGF